MRQKILTLLISALACFLLIQTAAFADTKDSKCVTVDIGEIFCMEMYPDDCCLDWTHWPYKPTINDFKAGTTIPDHPEGWTTPSHVKIFLIRANTPWVMTVQGTCPTFTCDNGQFPGSWQEKPCTDIVWNRGYGFRHITTDPQFVRQGPACKYSVVYLSFKVLLDICNDKPGEYHYEDVVFTLGAQ